MTEKEAPPSNPHRLIAAWIEKEVQARSTARKNGWPVQAGPDQTDIGRRLLQLHDAILKAGEARDYTAEIPKDTSNSLGFSIRGEHVSWRIREGYRRRKVPLSKTELKEPFNIATGTTMKTVDEPTGMLVLYFTAPYSVDKRLEDTPEKPLKSRIGEILDKMDAAAVHAAARHEEDNLAWRRRIEERSRSIRYDKLVAREKKRWLRLRQATADRCEVDHLRETVAIVRKRMSDGGIDTPRIEAWLGWAHARIDRLDPMLQEPEALFNRLVARARALTDYEREFGKEDEEAV